MTNDERAMRLRLAPATPDTVAVGESYYIRTNMKGVAINAAQVEHARRHGYVGDVLHVELVKTNLFEVVLATSERVAEDPS